MTQFCCVAGRHRSRSVKESTVTASVFKIFLLWIAAGLTCLSATASEQTASESPASVATNPAVVGQAKIPLELPASIVRDPYEFAGLATYYNQVFFYSVRNGVVSQLLSTQHFQRSDDTWLIAAGRFNAVAIRHVKSSVVIDDGEGAIVLSDSAQAGEPIIYDKAALGGISADLYSIKYHNLWRPFASMARLAETTVHTLHSWLQDWFLTLVAFSLLVKILLYPLNYFTRIAQNKVDSVKAAITPKISEIKQRYDGEEAHNKIMAAYKEIGVSPFYTLKPVLITLIQIPVLIATFDALGEYTPFRGAHLLWISDLAYPDSVGQLPISLPLVGGELSLLPLIMAAVTLALGYISNNHKMSIGSVLLAVAFLVLFYPFPAVLVLYWTLVNVWHLVFVLFESRRKPLRQA